MKFVKKCRANYKVQKAIMIVDVIAVLILGPIMIATQGGEGAFFDFAFSVFQKCTLPIIILSLFALLSIIFIDLKENWIIFIPIYILLLISIIGNLGYSIWIIYFMASILGWN